MFTEEVSESEQSVKVLSKDYIKRRFREEKQDVKSPTLQKSLCIFVNS